jgi:DNA-binding beta-propeller fold protein YncE
MTLCQRHCLWVLSVALLPASVRAQQVPAIHYHMVREIALPGDGGWDYLAYDPGTHHLFVSHATEVNVVDPGSGAVVGGIPDIPGVHGIAFAPELGRGFISDGRDSTVTIFDLHSLAVLRRVTVTGRNPDAILYEPVTHRVFTFNGRSANVTGLDARTGAVLGTIALGGKPEFAVADGHGGIFVNIEDKSEVVFFDARTLVERARWNLPGCEEPSGLAFDAGHERLFSVCGNGVMVILDAASGQRVASVPIGDGVDAARFDAATALAFASNGDGTLTVIREVTPDSFRVAETVPTQRGARTMELDPVTHHVFLSVASFAPASADSSTAARPRRSMVPGSFRVLVLAP